MIFLKTVMNVISVMCISLLFLVSSVLADSAFETVQGQIERSSLGLYGGEPEDIVTASNGNVYVALRSANGIFCANSQLDTWKAPPEGSDFGTVAAITVGENADTLYIIGGVELYKSDDACASWEKLQGPNGQSDFNMSITYGHDILLVAYRDGTISRSTDYGETLSAITVDTGVTSISALAASPAENTFFTLVQKTGLEGNFLYTSIDGGVTWTTLNKQTQYTEVAVNPNNSQQVIIAGAQGAEISTDGGTTWNNANATGIIKPSISFWGTDKIVISERWTDNLGTTWHSLNDEAVGLSSSLEGFFAADPSNTNIAYIASDRGVSKTTDGGSTWVDIVSGMLGVKVYDIAQSSDKETVYIGATGGIAKITSFTDVENRAVTYPIMVESNAPNVNAILVDPENANNLVVGAGSRIFYSTSGATSFTEATGDTITGYVLDLARMDDGTLVAVSGDQGTRSGGALKSLDGGVTWTDMSMPNSPHANTVIAIGSELFVGVGLEFDSNTTTNKGIYHYDGSSWEQLSGDMDGYIIDDMVYTGTTFFAAGGETQQSGVFRSTDAGVTWTLLGSSYGLDSMSWYRTLAFDPITPTTIYVASGRPAGTCYIYASQDNGDTWSEYYKGLKDEVPYAMLVDALTAGFDTGAYEFTSSADDTLEGPIYALWNGFLDMTNILEVVNKGSSPVDVTITMYDIEGNAGSAMDITLAAQGQRDIILNELDQFSQNSYGIVKIEWLSGDVDGRLSFYRSSSTGGGNDYEFSFAVPFENSLSGITYVGFNTFQPSRNALESNYVVTNWLSIVNLDTESSHDFTVNRFSQSGEQLGTEVVTVPAFGRRDVDGGHGLGASVVGLNQIVPESNEVEYKALVVRYGANATAGQTPTSYSFAFPLLAKAPGGAQQWVPISSGSGGTNWVEVVNTSDQPITGTISFFDNQGSQIYTLSAALELDAYAQVHINASSMLDAGASGAALISTESSGQVVGQSMFYFYDSLGSVSAMYGSQFNEAKSGTLVGSWNLYLGMYNWLRVFNTGETSADVSVTVWNDGVSSEKVVHLNGRSGIDLGLHETSTYGNETNSYGIVTATSDSIMSELLRIKPTSDGGIDFAMPTKMR